MKVGTDWEEVSSIYFLTFYLEINELLEWQQAESYGKEWLACLTIYLK